MIFAAVELPSSSLSRSFLLITTPCILALVIMGKIFRSQYQLIIKFTKVFNYFSYLFIVILIFYVRTNQISPESANRKIEYGFTIALFCLMQAMMFERWFL